MKRTPECSSLHQSVGKHGKRGREKKKKRGGEFSLRRVKGGKRYPPILCEIPQAEEGGGVRGIVGAVKKEKVADGKDRKKDSSVALFPGGKEGKGQSA